MSSSQVIEMMRQDGCRITKQRRLIIDTILSAEYSSCKEIYYQVSKADSSIGLATVYRMINQLEDMHVIRRVERIEILDRT